MDRQEFLTMVMQLEEKYGCRLEIEIIEHFEIKNSELNIRKMSVDVCSYDTDYILSDECFGYSDDLYAELIVALDQAIPDRTRYIFGLSGIVDYKTIAKKMVDTGNYVFDQKIENYQIVIELDKPAHFDNVEFKDACEDDRCLRHEITTNFDSDALREEIMQIMEGNERNDLIRYDTERALNDYLLRQSA